MNSLKRPFLSFYLMGALSDRAKNREQSLDKVKSMTLEPECLDLIPSMVLCWFLESMFLLGGMFIWACAEVYNTCEGVKEVRWGRRSR